MTEPVKTDLLKQLKDARRVSVPLVAINTPDTRATITAACGAINGDSAKVEWDYVRGLVGLNKAGEEWVKNLPDDAKMNPAGALIAAQQIPGDAVLFFHMANRWIGQADVVQAAWNLRDEFKKNHRMLIFLARHCDLPPELAEDVIVFDEPLPTGEQLRGIVQGQYDAANSELGPKDQLTLDEATAEAAVEALRGLPAFASEQITAMSLSRAGVNVDRLWERKKQQIEQTPGLSVFKGGETFADIGGLNQVKQYLTDLMAGNSKPVAITWLDEIEKSIPGGTNDLSGVSQDQLGQILSYMEDEKVLGVLLVGPPGSGKSAAAKAAGNTAGIPTVRLDVGACTGSLVGESQLKIRNALKVISAVSNHKAMFIATANSIANLDSALKRRFPFIFYFDLPTREEKNVIWKIWLKHYSLASLNRPDDEGWSGANIQKCCECAWRLNKPVAECAKYIVACAKVSGREIEALRKQADGAFLSASDDGVYTLKREPEAATGTGRKLNLAEAG